MKEEWILVGRYVSVIITALLLGLILGQMDLFQKTAVVTGKLSASHVVRFLAWGGALVVFWMTVRQVTVIFANMGGRWAELTHVILPVGALTILATAYGVLLLILGPVMGPSLRTAYNWLFILAILGASGWLLVAMFNRSSALTEAIIGKIEKKE